MTRPPAALAVLLATGVTLAGCGKDERLAPTGTAGRQAATGAHRGHAVTPSRSAASSAAKALAFARAVNLRASDVPGFSVSSESRHERGSAAERRLERELHRCVGSASETSSLAEASSPQLERKASLASQSVSSAVSVERSPAAGAEVLASFRSGRLRTCLSHYFDLLLAGESLHRASVSPVSVKHGSPPAPGMTGSFALRFTATITVDHVPIPFYVDILGFVDGPAAVTLLTSGIPEPIPAKLEEHLFSLLVERAKSGSV